MSWIEDAVSVVLNRETSADTESASAVADLVERLEVALSKTTSIEEIQEILRAGSVLLQTASLKGELLFLNWTKVLRGAGELQAPSGDSAVIALGDIGHSLLAALAAGPESQRGLRRLFLDVETSRPRDVDPEVVSLVLESYPTTETDHLPRYGDILRAAYRGSAGSDGLPPVIAETIQSSLSGRITVHVVVGLEEPWVSLVPDLLFDLRSFLDWGRRGTCVLHLLTRPSPQIRGSFRESLDELEQTKPFDDAFLICASQEFLIQKVATFLGLCATAPEVLFRPTDVHYRGAFSSYGTAPVPVTEEEDPDRYLAHLDTVLRSAVPSWTPANAVLSELAAERFLYVHPLDAPLRDVAWKLCPEFTPVPLDGVEPTLCRIQRGLRLEDLRLR